MLLSSGCVWAMASPLKHHEQRRALILNHLLLWATSREASGRVLHPHDQLKQVEAGILSNSRDHENALDKTNKVVRELPIIA